MCLNNLLPHQRSNSLLFFVILFMYPKNKIKLNSINLIARSISSSNFKYLKEKYLKSTNKISLIKKSLSPKLRLNENNNKYVF
jgi:hypothetical protein